MCAVHRKLHDDYVVVEVHVVELSVHVGEGSGVHVDGRPDFRSVVFLPARNVVEVAAFSKERDELLGVLGSRFSEMVKPTNELLVALLFGRSVTHLLSYVT